MYLLSKVLVGSGDMIWWEIKDIGKFILWCTESVEVINLQADNNG